MMSARPRWDCCVRHRGEAVAQFVRDYFGQTERRVKLIAGAGFDPRSSRFPELLAATAPNRVSGLFLREQRPSPRPEVLRRAEENERRMRELIPANVVEGFDIL